MRGNGRVRAGTAAAALVAFAAGATVPIGSVARGDGESARKPLQVVVSAAAKQNVASPVPPATHTLTERSSTATIAPAAGDTATTPKRRRTAKGAYELVLHGGWVQPGCVPTMASLDVEAQSGSVECVGIAPYRGHLNGYAVQHIKATTDSAGVTRATIVADIYARTAGNLCGTLHLDPEETVGSNGAATGVGPITSGTDDFEGVTGWYDTAGMVESGAGAGGYTITLWFDEKPTPSAEPCIPPTPKA